MSSSLIFYKDKNYADSAPQPVAHGGTGQLAASATSWTYQSVGVTPSAVYSFVFSDVNTTNASMSYLGHVEDVISVSAPDLTALYPAIDQFPLNYLGLDQAVATIVWLDIAGSGAVASTSLVGGSSTSVTTLALPELKGALGFVRLTEGSSAVANCIFGEYDAISGTVAWEGNGTVVLEYIGGAVTILTASGFPADWSFGTPAPQGDGSWRIDVETDSTATNIIKDVQTDKESISNNGTDAATLTATVVDSGSGLPVQGVEVSWDATMGELSELTSVTNGNGQATTLLTDNGDEGSATVTATIPDSNKMVNITISQQSSSLKTQCLEKGLAATKEWPNFYSLMAIYDGSPDQNIYLTVSGTAVFKDSSDTSLIATLDSSGYALIRVISTSTTTCDINIFDLDSKTFITSIQMQFKNHSTDYGINTTNNALADNKMPNLAYNWEFTQDTLTIEQSSTALFSNGEQSITINNGGVVEFVDSIAETVKIFSKSDDASRGSTFVTV